MLKKIKFDDFVRLNRGFDLPDDKIIEGKYPVVTSTNIKAYHNEYKIEPPVVVTGRSGSLGKVQYIQEQCWPLNTALYSKDFKGNNPRYIYYFLQTMHLEQYNAGAGVPTLNQNHLQRLKINVHEIDEQEKVANILAEYDNLIGNNNKRIKLLEQMAENLYKEWFVRFRFPGHETVKFENGILKGWKKSSLGNIPGSFNVVKMKDVFQYYIGGGWGEEEYSESFNSDAYVIRGADFPKIENGDWSTCPYRYHKKSNYTARKLEPWDIILEVSGGTAEQPVGRTLIVTPELLNGLSNKVICASFCKQIRCDEKVISPIYFYYWMQYLYETRIIDRFQLQSTGIINFQFEYFLKKGDVLLPPMTLMKQFETKVKEIYKEKDNLAQQNQNLIKQRDLLLPRLMSGKLEVEKTTENIHKAKVISFEQFVSNMGMAARAKSISDSDLKAMYEAYIDDDATE